MSDVREVRDKALCYVVRDGRLLVFRHVDASPEEVGLQVPAGSVRPGETPEAAALREGREETGLTGLSYARSGWSNTTSPPIDSRSSGVTSSTWRWTARSPSGGPRSRSTTGWGSRHASNASGSPCPPGTCCSPDRGLCWGGCTTLLEIVTDEREVGDVFRDIGLRRRSGPTARGLRPSPRKHPASPGRGLWKCAVG
ncbi:NUDIX domain protein [Nocardiopsis alba ATCC BAA-2165]|uniref:NUDIX domain protein n=1 Tax=Nocardiopsis alba (strain ATCC BAA-2165 / BE74) TaxID=1205910 RepID=J7L3L4_NOCAA|nr:NUDIX domain protein [Nocardiopsis alba ATCC BAA-2165]